MKTKLPTPQQLPSGMYRCQVMVNGKRESVVDEDPDVCQAMAVALKNGLIEKDKPVQSLTVGEAIDRYIDSKDSLLSPSTIRNYKSIRKNKLGKLENVALSDLTQETVQRAINELSKGGSSPKTIRNIHGLLSSAIHEYYPKLVLYTVLPQKQRHEISIPTAADVDSIIQSINGTDLEIPVMLALWMGLRASEICGIKNECIDAGILHVKYARVRGENGYVEKRTKTYSGDRYLHIPTYIMGLIEKEDFKNGYLVQMTGQTIYEKFSRLCARVGVKHYRFHDLRHSNASIMLALNIPDKYAMERMGHATNNMLKTVYQHTMKDKQEEVANIVDDYFNQKLHTDLHT